MSGSLTVGARKMARSGSAIRNGETRQVVTPGRGRAAARGRNGQPSGTGGGNLADYRRIGGNAHCAGRTARVLAGRLVNTPSRPESELRHESECL
jgi:hypothetical protein